MDNVALGGIQPRALGAKCLEYYEFVWHLNIQIGSPQEIVCVFTVFTVYESGKCLIKKEIAPGLLQSLLCIFDWKLTYVMVTGQLLQLWYLRFVKTFTVVKIVQMSHNYDCMNSQHHLCQNRIIPG